MNIILTNLINYAIEIVSLVIITGIGVLGSMLLNKLTQNKKLKNITIATGQLISAAQETVLELQQTMVYAWKENQSGKLTEEQKELLQAQLLEVTLAKLTEPTLKLLAGSKADILTMITSAAESYIQQMHE